MVKYVQNLRNDSDIKFDHRPKISFNISVTERISLMFKTSSKTKGQKLKDWSVKGVSRAMNVLTDRKLRAINGNIWF